MPSQIGIATGSNIRIEAGKADRHSLGQTPIPRLSRISGRQRPATKPFRIDPAGLRPKHEQPHIRRHIVNLPRACVPSAASATPF
jgi:hypothetical protein